MGTIIIIGMLVFLLVLFAAQGFRIVQQAETMVIERLGAYHRTLDSGVNFIWPIIDKAREIEWRYIKSDVDGRTVIKKEKITRIDLRETVYDFPKQSVITRDNVAIEINAILYFQITDPVRAIYEIANLPDAIEKLAQTTLRNVIGEMDLDHTLSSRDEINRRLKSILDDATEKWGVKVNRVELQDIHPPEDIIGAMKKQMRAERDRRAAILEAEGSKQSRILESEGFKESEINKAEGEKRAKILMAEGEAEARIKVAEAEAAALKRIKEAITADRGSPAQYLIAIRYIETLKEMVTGKDSKVVYMPYEATGVLSSLGGIREILDGVSASKK
ncbi:MAG: SPFH/Band 7/PHB domain protein [Candidatus Manganitrophaceae bacterium]|nr:MAG: SPFH/Band 7/PHB domain protein [Candidatus Manganitrophaceae bacterium]